MITHLYHNIRFLILKKKIKRNPYIDKEDIDGTYDYKQGNYGIRYRIIKEVSGRESIEWISQRRTLSGYEKEIKKMKHWFFDFWHYQRWLVFFRPSILFLLIMSIFIFYFGLAETQKTKVERFKWIIASAIGISPQQIQYIGDRWLEISAQRKTAVDRINEPVRYIINPFRWLFSSEAGFARRWRGRPYGYATHPVVYNERGEVWINKEGTWRHGIVSGKTMRWDIPQGTGIRAGKVTGHEKYTQDGKLYTPDK